MLGRLGRPATFIFDIDGVLCDSDSYTKAFIEEALVEIGPVPEGQTKWNWIENCSGWKDYHPYDQPTITAWALLLRALYCSGFYIVILTSRTENIVEGADGELINKKERTLAWLNDNSLPFDEFIMWGGPETCSYDEFKVGKVKELQERLDVQLAIDDHEGHVNAYKSSGIPFLHVHPDHIR